MALRRCRDRQVVFGYNFRRNGRVSVDAMTTKSIRACLQRAAGRSLSILMHIRAVLAATMIDRLESCKLLRRYREDGGGCVELNLRARTSCYMYI